MATRTYVKSFARSRAREFADRSSAACARRGGRARAHTASSLYDRLVNVRIREIDGPLYTRRRGSARARTARYRARTDVAPTSRDPALTPNGSSRARSDISTRVITRSPRGARGNARKNREEHMCFARVVALRRAFSPSTFDARSRMTRLSRRDTSLHGEKILPTRVSEVK